jgi:hypothetical protein
MACQLQAEMFWEVSNLDVQLVFYRGLGECRASGWVSSGERLANLMSGIICRAGQTQIGKILAHARSETEKNKVEALVFVGDAMEENLDELVVTAAELGREGLKAFMFQEGEYRTWIPSGHCPLPRRRSPERGIQFWGSGPSAMAKA